MKNKFNYLMGIMCLFASAVANGQGSSVNPADISGSPYLDDTYVDGVIYHTSKNQTVPIRYNAFQDLMEYKQNGKALVWDPSTTIKKVSFGTSTFVVMKYELNKKSKLGYLAVLDSGKVTLFSKKTITFIPAKKGGALDGSDQLAQFKRSPDVFFYKIEDGALQEVENIKSLIASFPDKQEELTRFAKKEKISPRKEKEIIQLVQYYNSL